MRFDPTIDLLEFECLETNGEDEFVTVKYAINAMEMKCVVKLGMTEKHERFRIKSGFTAMGRQFILREEYNDILAVFKQALKFQKDCNDGVIGRYRQLDNIESTISAIKLLVETTSKP